MPSPTRIVDAHVHLWDLETNNYPFMKVKRDYTMFAGDQSSVYHTFLLPDLQADAGLLPVEKFVHVQAHMGTDDPSRETAWLQQIADAHGNPRAAVGFARLQDHDVEQVLVGHSKFPIFRGIRQSLNWHSDRVYSMCDRPDYLTDPTWQRGYALLSKYNLSFDLQVYPHQLKDSAALAGRFSDVPLILEHCGFPIDRSPEGMAEWRQGMRDLAKIPNCVVKLSGVVLMDHAWTVASLKPIIRETVEIFGPGRTMFGSNFPVDKVHITYAQSVNAVVEALGDLRTKELDDVFYGTASRTYRI